ncbi:MAG: adenosine deaminase [Paludibacteraceae bacterium]|nr:adenosine deaminase [Paludibacteraceae bacterium]
MMDTPSHTSSYPAWIDLHLHLDGSMPLPTARKLAERQGITLPSGTQALRRHLSVADGCKDLNDYLSRFVAVDPLLQNEEAITTCMADLLEELHRQGLQYVEVRFAPQRSCKNGLTQYEAAEAALKAMRHPPLPCGLILSMMRGDETLQRANRETVEVAHALYGKGVVAVDLAGAEALYPTHLFLEEFAAVRAAGLPLIVHAGEAAGADSVREAVECGAVRIGHGVRSLENEQVVRLLVERGVTLELCPTSNLNTRIFPSYEAYPLRRLLDAGVRVCVNTDNMTVSSTTLRDEWQHLIRTQQLRDEEIRRIVANTIDACFAPEQVKRQLLRLLEDIR